MDQLFLEDKSKFNFDETVSGLTSIIAEDGWKVTHIHDLQAIMHKNGLDVEASMVIELCNPDYAYRILSKDALRVYSNMMPCRIAVYTKTDGLTYISRMNAALLSSQIGGEAEAVMSATFRDAEGFIKKLVD